jgi:hypothetical protein
MKYYAIKHPSKEHEEPLYFYLDIDIHNCWNKFFSNNNSRMPLGEAIKAYKAIGYQCVEVNITEKK